MAETNTHLNTPNDGEWTPFAKLTKIYQPDKLIEGYCIPLDGKQFRIFVADEKTNGQRGYFLKLMYMTGKEKDINLTTQQKDFPQTTSIFERYLPNSWTNKGSTYHCYKYIIFGKGLSNKHLALSLMHSIIASIIN